MGQRNKSNMTTHDTIIENEKHLLEALKNSDLKKMEVLLHDELLFHIPNGQTITKAMDLESYRSGLMTIHEISSEEQVIHVIDNIAVVSVVIKLKGKYTDQLIDGKFRYLRVWKLVGSDWKVIAGSCIPL